jgi:hypothetical protein
MRGEVPPVCYEFTAEPLAVPLKLRRAKSGDLVLTYSLLLGKVTEKKYKHHRSTHGFTYPIGRPVSDRNAIVGDHEFGLHFAASPFDTLELSEYGSHRLAVLPGPKLWDPVTQDGLTNRCWHANGCLPAACLDCENLSLPELTNPLFWQDLSKWSGSAAADCIYNTPLYKIWHRSRALKV